jgi:glucosamine kinase
VVFLGGLGPFFAAQLQGRWDIRPALGSALDGALMLAREAA